MKKVLSVLFLSFVAIPVLTVTPAAANNGDEDGNGHKKEEHLTKWNQHLKFGERDRDYRGYWGRRLDDGPNTPVSGTPTSPGGNGSGQSAPLDGGLSLLLAAGIGLGVKRVSNMRKASRKDNNEIPE